jgi:predicted ATPase
VITSIKVNGFRSLSGFTMNLLPGLNILVGPNGAGKTNIISFFEFLSHIISCGPSEAVNRIGGAGSVFTKTNENEFQNYMDVDLLGCTETSPQKCVQYRYSFLIEASENFDSIRYKKQLLKLRVIKKFQIPDNSIEDSFTVTQESKDCKKYTSDIKNYSEGLIDSSFLPSSMLKQFSKDKNTITEFLKNNVEYDMPLIISLSFFIEATRFISSDLRGGQIFNIIPSRVKHPEESSNPIGIQKDGSGLASTLYAIKNKKYHQEEILLSNRFFIKRGPFSTDLRETTINDILKYLKTANSAISNIDIENDPFDNLLKVKFLVGKENNSALLPLSSMSDGTIKWLSLVTAILTTPSIFSIEEPENFLHPLMQAEVVKLMRNASESKKKKMCILMSTHSETILNHAKPSEVVIISFNDGKTNANRCENQEEINDEIKKTGFGLGFYYMSGSLTNA